ncbi:MAG: long-chain acyl-CoA synthetase [Verrucomicrobia bacterium]|nr:MAG: long-chain acyl-CoA synthetase [Verrucomicrobiota bacterium]
MTGNILAGFLAQAAARPEAPALFLGEECWSYAWLASSAREACEQLRSAGAFDCGAQPVARIGLYCPNGVAHVVWALGILLGGGCLVPVPQELAECERESLVRRTALHAVVGAGGLSWSPAGGARELRMRFQGEESCSLCLLEPATDPGFSEADFAALAPALIRFSSGTTGASKGVVLSHASLLERIQSANRRLGVSAADRVLWTLPMAHHFAVSILLYLNAGAGVILEDSHLAEALLGSAKRWGATVMYGAPYHFRLLASESSARCWDTLRLAVSTAAALTGEIARRFYERFGIPLTQGFGIIEAGLPLLNLEGALEAPTALGRPDDFELVLLDKNGAAANEGELCLRGPGMFDAYLTPWQPRACVLREGWFHTGDIARRDAFGSIELLGRLKSVLNIGGMKCFPEEIEEVLLRHPGVAEARVRGEENERWGTFVVADIVLEEGFGVEEVRPAELAQHCRKSLAQYKVPVRFVVVERLEKTASGKVRR